ncbi:MAG: DUF1045 domain-containing protein [Pseudomonadota bacterium]
MSNYQRYALYYAPPSGSALARFGASWLGWDVEAGAGVSHPDVNGFDVAAATETPRKYGFHGTMKPPFRLADGSDADGLAEAVATLASAVPAFEAPPLALRRLGPFLALVPSAPSASLADLAGRCVMDLDRFRAPQGEAELAKRRANGLTAEQDALLLQWGYPYVLSEFRFHLTLTGRLDDATAEHAIDVLSPLTAPLCTEPMPVREICLCGEAQDGRFRLIHRYALAS